MGKKDPRIDAYLGKIRPFARPVLRRIRTLVHKGCPNVEETLKWGHPAFMYKGILCGFASFTAHCTFGFWKGSLIIGANKGKTEEAMGQFGRITALGDLPGDSVMLGYIREAVRLNDEGKRVPTKTRSGPRQPLRVPAILKNALDKNRKAKATFDSFSYSNKKEYVEWIAEAKSEETKQRRVATAIEWMAEGKVRNWKYVR